MSQPLKLMNMILSNDPAAKVEDYLNRCPPNVMSLELTQRDTHQMTPLHLVVEKADFQMTKVLLSFDAPVNAKIGTQSIEDFAKERVNRAPHEGRKRVYALLKSRGKWQSTAASAQGIIFSRSMQAIVDAVDRTVGAANKLGVLFVGITGEGKSTFINYLYGVDYKIEKIKLRKKVVPNGSEVAPVGDSTTSLTLLPQVIDNKLWPYVLVDLPGFEDTRGTAEEICAAASICMLTKQLSKIQAISMVCSCDTLSDVRMVNYRKAAYNIGAMINKDLQAAENVVLIVTKPESDLTEDDVRERLEELAKGEGWVGPKATPVDREDLNDDDWKKHCLRMATEAVLSSKGSIVIADVTNPQARAIFQERIKALQQKAKNSSQFDFKNYSRFMTQFKTVMEGMIVHYNVLIRDAKSIKEKLTALAGRVIDITREKKEYEASIAKNEKQKLEPFTEESFDQKIKEEKERLRELRERVTTQRAKLQNAELEAKVKSAKVDGIEKSGERQIDIIRRDWDCVKREDIKYHDIEETGETITHVDGRKFMVVKKVEKTIKGTEKTVSEPINYPTIIPIQRFVDKSQGGKFETKSFISGVTQINGTFISSPGAQGNVNLNVELYGKVEDFPETKDRINRLEREKSDALNELEIAKKEQVPDQEVEASEERLRKLELEKISAVGNHQRTKEICEMQIQLLGTQLKKAQEKLTELSKEEKDLKMDLEDKGLQLEVNEDLFTRLKQVIQWMDFKGEVIEDFMKNQDSQKRKDTPKRHGH